MNTLDFYMFRWVARAALHVNVDHSDIVKVSLSTILNLDIVLEEPTIIPSNNVFDARKLVDYPCWIQPYHDDSDYHLDSYAELAYHKDEYTVEDACLDFDRERSIARVQNEFFELPRFSVIVYMHAELQPDVNDRCPICRLKFSDSESRTCHRLNVCGHAYHSNCLQTWTNSFKEGGVDCPYCRKLIGIVVKRDGLACDTNLAVTRPWANATWWKGERFVEISERWAEARRFCDYYHMPEHFYHE